MTYRPEVSPRWTSRANITTLSITRLSKRHATAIIEHQAGGKRFPSELIDQIGFEVQWKSDPVPMGEAFAAVLPDAPRLVSGAGHDAMVVPNSSMLFVRSLNGGVSHHPDELSSAEDVALAIDALVAALDRVAR